MKFQATTFIKSAGILITGTVLAQVISLVSIPVISRIFGPEENAYLGLFLKITTLAATLFTARLEMVLPIEKKQHYAFGIYQFSLRLSLIFSGISLGILLLYASFYSEDLTQLAFILFIPFGIFIISFFNLGNSWELRHENYKAISSASVLLSLFSNGFKILGGLVFGSYLVLIVATIIAYIIASIGFFKSFLLEFKSKILSHKSKRTKYLVKENRDFYTFNLFHVIIDLTKDILLATFLWMYFSKLDYGSYEFSFRIMRIPIALIGVAMSQVYFRKAQYYSNNPRELERMTIKTLLISTWSVIPFGVIFFYGQEVFTFVFGEQWAQAGKIAELISPWLFFNFLMTPISYIPIIFKKQKAYFWINVVFLFVLIIFGTYSLFLNFDLMDFLKGILITHVVCFMGLITWFYFLIFKYKRCKVR